MRIVKLLALAGMVAMCAIAQQTDDASLAKAAQNPIAKLISVPIQNNLNFGLGPYDRIQNITNIQPVIPVTIGKWNLINRTIMPVIRQPDIASPEGAVFGLGDINHTTFISPAQPGRIVWGVGPSITLRSATDDMLGSGKWSAGPSAVVLTMPGKWVIGALVNNIWSFAGDSERAAVNAFLLQYFVNYNLPKGWYLSSAPIITANWKAKNGKWTVPFGGGVGRVFRIGKQAMNAQVQAFGSSVRPENGPSWTLRLQLQFLFPK